MSMVKVTNVVKKYGAVKALDGIDLEIEQGEWVAIMGPSGSGKTTLLNLLGCLDVPTSGSIVVDGQDVARFSANELAAIRRERIGFIFQQFHLVPYLSALENVMLAQHFHSMANIREARGALDAIGMGDRARHKPSQLSGGEQQRVCIARALINDPAILLADEPTGNLDRKNEEVVLDLLRECHAQGRTIVLVTHNPEIARHADTVVVLSHGRLASGGTRGTRRCAASPMVAEPSLTAVGT
ncbi:MAG: ABC transporter ATP-binding protein [Acidobacteria bacterium]|nr:ABC transporter ATP-binding protein [Acidobacteriota bacterium]